MAIDAGRRLVQSGWDRKTITGRSIGRLKPLMRDQLNMGRKGPDGAMVRSHGNVWQKPPDNTLVSIHSSKDRIATGGHTPGVPAKRHTEPDTAAYRRAVALHSRAEDHRLAVAGRNRLAVCSWVAIRRRLAVRTPAVADHNRVATRTPTGDRSPVVAGAHPRP